jgi:hypothetical protein
VLYFYFVRSMIGRCSTEGLIDYRPDNMDSAVDTLTISIPDTRNSETCLAFLIRLHVSRAGPGALHPSGWVTYLYACTVCSCVHKPCDSRYLPPEEVR